MRVLYDSMGFEERFGGVSRSFAKLIAHLPPEVEPVLAVKRTCNLALQEAPFGVAPYPDRSEAFLKGWNFRGKWRVWRLAQRMLPRVWPDFEAENRRCLEEHVAHGDFDVLHLTGAHAYAGAWKRVVGKKPVLITVHDLIPEIVRGRERVAAMRREILAACDRVIAVSENTKRDLMRLYGVEPDRIAVIRHGWESEGTSGWGGRPAASGSYLLYVGKREGYKNWTWFAEAVAPMLRGVGLAGADRTDGIELVCTGNEFTFSERRLLRRLGIAGRVKRRFAATEGEMAGLYRNAAAFVCPSAYEGFGLPILDAWAAECPVVLARASCFPEIAGNAAEYFELGDAEGLRSAIRAAMGNRRLAGLGKERLAAFDWGKSSRELAAVYEGLTAGGGSRALRGL